jgi:phosphatidylserine/phosphatidylglycerophosphate/cardiolipin synthase-like enzyme
MDNSRQASSSRPVQEGKFTTWERRLANNSSLVKATVPISLSMVKAATCALTYSNARKPEKLIDLQDANAAQQNQAPYSSSQGQQQKPDLASKLFDGLHGAIYGIGTDIAGKLGTHYEPQPYGTSPGQGGYSAQAASRNRFGSFASPKNGNDVKWHVDGCSYMWAVSKALEGARESIWILDCRTCRPLQRPSLTRHRVVVTRALS